MNLYSFFQKIGSTFAPAIRRIWSLIRLACLFAIVLVALPLAVQPVAGDFTLTAILPSRVGDPNGSGWMLRVISCGHEFGAAWTIYPESSLDDRAQDRARNESRLFVQLIRAPGRLFENLDHQHTAWGWTFRPARFLRAGTGNPDERFAAILLPRRVSVAFAALVLVLVMAIGLRRLPGKFMAFKRRRRGLCKNCGYNLRASKNRCPECGERVSPATNRTGFITTAAGKLLAGGILMIGVVSTAGCLLWFGGRHQSWLPSRVVRFEIEDARIETTRECFWGFYCQGSQLILSNLKTKRIFPEFNFLSRTVYTFDVDPSAIPESLNVNQPLPEIGMGFKQVWTPRVSAFVDRDPPLCDDDPVSRSSISINIWILLTTGVLCTPAFFYFRRRLSVSEKSCRPD